MILVGVILGAHGIKGEVKLKSFTEDPKAIAAYKPLLAKSGVRFEITRLKPQVSDFICTLNAVSDRNQAEALKGTELFITREQLPKDELYLHDLIGVAVFNRTAPLGTVSGFENFGAGDVMDVKMENTTVLIPYTKAFIVEASRERVVVDLPEDYLDETKPA